MADPGDTLLSFIHEWVLRLLRIKAEIGLKMMNTEVVKTVINDFLDNENPSKLIIYQISGNQLVAETEFPKNPKSKCVYFVKRIPCVLPKVNYKPKLIYGDLPCALIEVLPVFVNGLLLPLLSNKNITQLWPVAVVKDIHYELHDLRTTVEQVCSLVVGKPLLALPNGLEKLEEFEKMAIERGEVCDEELLSSIEMVSRKWNQLVEHIIQQDSSYCMKLGLNPGPMYEVNFWKTRRDQLKSISDQFKSKEIKSILTIMEKTNNSYYPALKCAIENIEKALIEAKDISRYLTPLQVHFLALETSEFAELTTLLLPMMHVVCLAWSMSKYYCSTSKIIVLLKEITNQLIEQARVFLDSSSLFQLEIPEGLEKIEKVYITFKTFMAIFYAQKRIIGTYFQKINAPIQEWDFPISLVFENFDLFIGRLQLIQNVFETSSELMRLEKMEIGNRNGRILSNALAQIYHEFMDTYLNFANRTDDTLEIKNKQFVVECEEVMTKVNDWDKRLGCIICQAFDDCANPELVFKLLAMIGPLLERPVIKKDCDLKYPRLVALLDVEMQNAREIYDQHLLVFKSTGKFPLYSNIPPVAGRLFWAHHLRERISAPMGAFQQLEHPVVSSDEAKSVFKKYRDLMGLLDQLENQAYNVWKQTVGDVCRTYVRHRLIVKDKETGLLKVNFDEKLAVVLKEVKYLLLLERTDIPPSASSLFERGLELNQYIFTLDQVVFWYNRLKSCTLDVEFSMIEKEMLIIDEKLKPAEEDYSWTSRDVWKYITETNTVVQNLDCKVEKAKCNVKEIKSIMASWNASPLFERPEGKRETLLSFDNRLEKVNKRYEEVNAAGVKIKQFVKENMELLKSSDGDEDREKWEEYVCYIDAILRNSFHDMILCSLYYLLDNTDSAVVNSPLFEIRLTLDGTEKSFRPPLDSRYANGFLVLVERLMSDILKMASLIPRLSRSNSETNFQVELENCEEISDVQQKIVSRVESVITKATEFAAQFDKYEHLWAKDMSAFLDEFLKTGRPLTVQEKSYMDKAIVGLPPQLEDFKKQIDSYESVLEDAGKIISFVIFDGWFKVDIKPFKFGFINLINRWSLLFKQYLMDNVVNSLKELDQFIRKIEEGLSSPIEDGNYDALVLVMRHLMAVRERQEGTDEMFEPLKETVDLLRTYNWAVPDDIHVQLQELPEKWNSTKKLVSIVKTQVIPLQTNEVGNINRRCASFEGRLVKFKDQFKSYAFYGPDCESPYELINKADEEVSKMEEESAKIQEAANLFELNIQDFQQLRYCRRDIGLLKHLWDYILLIRNSINEWKKTLWANIDIEQMDLGCKKFAKDIRALDKEIKTWSAYIDLDLTVKNLLTALRAVGELQNAAIRERHWNQLMHATGVQFVMDDKTTLADLLALNLHNYEDEVRGIVDKAVKEMSMEKILKELNSIWSTMEFEHELHSRTGCNLLKASEDLIGNLEDNQVQMQNILTSKYVSFFLKEVSSWQKQLSTADQVITIFLEIQRTWLHLESIFTGSEDLRKQLPEDSNRFDETNSAFRVILQNTLECKNVIKVTNQPGLYSKLDEIQKNLTLCEKALAEYLDTKRLAFPRFYFVSSADLLDILSSSSQPRLVMRHLTKLFDSIANLKFKEEDENCKIATGMIAKDGEYVPFDKEFSCSGQVEVWLNCILDTMKSSIRYYLGEAVGTYEEKAREHWLFDYPAQVSLCGTQIGWANEVNAAFARLEDGFDNALKDYYKKQIQQLNTLITLLIGELSAGDRQKIMTICTVDVHARDVVAKMVSSKIENAQAFLWQSQLRHRWDEQEKDCFANICDAQFRYCHEYLGNTPRLVITPLTDRCYITLTQSLHLIMGGGPAGPAGTGKTETTKDLGRALGIMVYVFNCSEQMDYRSCASLFKGLAQTGAWGCFDEFNRISVEVLSVVAVQVKSILDAIRDCKTIFDFVGEEIPLNPTVGMFITMNPGYAGRTELPENVKALFRPCAMCVPDFELICEIMLVAEGFLDARKLARKFITLYTLCKELLSKQDHYDWGLRAIKSVLVVAGSLKRGDPGRPEDQVLMRALRDFNVPKIVTEDIPVFLGLIGDLFPSLDVPRKRELEFETAVREASSDLQLQPEDNFILKVVQLAELLHVRHSVFIVGNAGTGKTKVWKTLFKTYQNMNLKPVVHDLDPKAVTNDELFGIINRATREWKDGLFSTLMRELANAPGSGYKWIVLDGDIDPMWIESLNTVMDDNKILTLASNERISLTPSMRLLFEISNLKNATPATVSRAGILYINPQDLGWNPYVSSWIDKRPTQSERANLMILFDKYVPTCLEILRNRFKKITPITDISHVQALCYLLESLLTPANVPSDSPKELFELYFVFACVWAFGASLFHDQGVDHRVEFSKWWISEFKTVKFASQGTVFDYFIDPELKKFVHWAEKVPKFELDPERPLQTTLVHTTETTRLHFFVNLLMQNRRPVMLVGNAGCGKTVLINEILSNLPEEQYAVTKIPFNFYTTSEMLQRAMEKSLEKKAGRNFGPPGNKRLVYFIDDMNMPEVDMYDTVQPHTLIRQHLDYGHWFDRQKLFIKDIHSCQYVSCMNPTAGSFTITQRLLRHFCIFAVSFPNASSLQTIYNSILSQHLSNPILKFGDVVQQLSAIVSSTALALHQKVSQCFLPTAVKFHYAFNLRDLSNLYQGLLFSIPESVRNPSDFMRLLIHESRRVYQDKLVEEKDVEIYNKVLRDVIKKNFEDFDETILIEKPLIFCHFAKGIGEPKYMRIDTWETITKLLQDALDSYNEINTSMNLVLFEDAMQHICRINRILESPQGNALLVGVGGSGKQSLARLAAYISGLEVAQITMKTGYNLQDFMADLASLHIKAGLKNVGTVFLMTDAQVADERFLVLINDLLASGEVADLFSDDEIENMVGNLRSEVKAAGILDSRENCWRFFIDRVRRQLKVVLCFSPVGDTLRVRSRKFPAIINCTCIDWFHEWPQEALMSVSQRFLQEVEILPRELVPSVSQFMAYSHISVNDMSKFYLQTDRRYNYTTPKSFLEQIILYINLLKKKNAELQSKKERLENGLQKLRLTAGQVDDLKAKLAVQEVELKQKNDDADKLIQVVAQETIKVSEEKAIAATEEEKVAAINVEVSQKQQDCEADLVKAEPALLAAQDALNTLNKNNLTELKSFGSPPLVVINVSAAVMVLMAPNGKVPKDRSWKSSKLMMARVDQFLDDLIKFDKENIHPEILKAIRPYLDNPEFNPEFVRSKSLAAAGLCSWVINIVKFYEIFCDVEPKRLALKAANQELATAQEKLATIRAKIKELEEALATLTAEFERATEEKMRCQKEADKTYKTIELANRLIGGLASEKVRWAKAVSDYREQELSLPGDVLLVTAFISYVGCFTKQYRIDLFEKKWLPFLKCQEVKLPITEGLDCITLLTDDAKIAEWNNVGLPSDRMSTENATILTNSERWPLMIDPQLQGNKWIKSQHKGNITIIQLGQKGYLDTIEKAVQQGCTALIENIGENIDPVLDPLLGRNTIKKGTAIKMGDKEVEYNSKFRLVLHTKLANPHYKPELQAQTTLINFTVTKDGLEDQLLAEVVNKERPELETMKADLTKQQNDFKIALKDLEDSLLLRLSSAQGNFLGDSALVENLETTKRTAIEISEKVTEAKKTEAEINQARELYRPAAARASVLYFILNDLCKINPIYQFSLKAFKVVFNKAIERAEASDNVGVRVNNLIDCITYSVFLYTTRGLFERDKLTFTVQMTIQILLMNSEINPAELDFLLRYPVQPNMTSPVEFLSNQSWGGIKALSNLDEFHNLDRDIENTAKRWQKFVESEIPEKEKFPQEWKSKTSLQNLCMLRALRPDRMTYAVTEFVAEKLGLKYVVSRSIDLAQSFEESSPSTPFFFILSPGVNPLKDVEVLGRKHGFTADNRNFHSVSLGQGQEIVAVEALQIAAKEGHWVILQNIHLVKTWLPNLEKKLEEMSENSHPDYRVFLSAEPAKTAQAHIIPQGILESAIKITNEPPSGIKANLHKALDNFTQEILEMCSKEAEFKSILFSLCYFHAVISERVKFGPQGWNKLYPFNAGDLTICAHVLHNYLEASSRVPWEDLRYLFGEIMYGGHVTDDWDSRLCRMYLEEYMRPEQLEGELHLAPEFPTPPNMDYACYHQYIDEALPPESPYLYGLHPNAEIGVLTSRSESLFKTVLELQPRNAGGTGVVVTREEKVKQVLDETLEKLPDEFNMKDLSSKVEEKTPYTIVALQECECMNTLIREMRRSLRALDLGLKGELTITAEMELLSNALYLDQIPNAWIQLAYASQLGLGAWYADFLMRYKELESWTSDFQLPAVVWLAGFFNPQSFLTAIMQSTARKNEMPLDKMCLQVEVTKKMTEDITSPPREGAYIHGLYMEGGRWEFQAGMIVEPKLKELYPPMPVIYVKAIHIDKQDIRSTYACPVYKTRSRGQTYVWTFNLKTKEKASKWVLAGTALLLQV